MVRLIEYNQHNTPEDTGVYACRVPAEIPGFYKDIFLMWFNNRWCYLGSDQYYRGEVTGWIGPLQRNMD